MTRALGLFYAACALASGIYGSVFWIARDRGPQPEAFAPAAAVIRSGWQPGDLILLVPFYATRAREHLGDLHPVAPRDPLAEDLSVHPRVWVFGLFGEAEKLRADMLAAGHELAESVEPSAGITIDRYAIKDVERVAYSFRDRLKDARVFHEHEDGTREPCASWSDVNGQGGPMGRWSCPHDAEWFYVAPEWHRMGDHSRFCLWAHPPNAGRLLIVYPNVPMSGRLAGHAGHTLNGSIHAREKIFLDVEVAGAGSQRFTLPLLEHWRRFALKTPETGTATVTFAVSTPDAGANHFCFTADMREPAR